MAENTFTHVPVVKNGIFQWLLSESVFVQWLSEVIEKGEIITEATSVSQLRNYMFLSREADVYQIKEEFERVTRERKDRNFKRLGVIFISNSGKPTEKILGLITAWDIGKINIL